MASLSRQTQFQELQRLHQEALAAVGRATEVSELERLRLAYLGRKGSITAWLKRLGQLPEAERKRFGTAANRARDELQRALAERSRQVAQRGIARRMREERLDVTLPGRGVEPGSLHPLTLALERIVSIFARMGFEAIGGPEIEDEYHNFEALNISADHPARSMHDTFFLEDGRLLRTHTSSMQVHALTGRKPPLRLLAPGRVYRRDHDVTHSPMFHQVEGLMLDERISFAELKGLLNEFVRYFFDRELPVRFRPSYFPFTEPSAEMDIRWGEDWLEILGCGMVHPQVLRNADIDSERYLGLAFGMGVERLAMLHYGIDDIRLFFANDVRFLAQFDGARRE